MEQTFWLRGLVPFKEVQICEDEPILQQYAFGDYVQGQKLEGGNMDAAPSRITYTSVMSMYQRSKKDNYNKHLLWSGPATPQMTTLMALLPAVAMAAHRSR